MLLLNVYFVGEKLRQMFFVQSNRTKIKKMTLLQISEYHN